MTPPLSKAKQQTSLLEKWAASMLLEAQAEMDIGQLVMHLPDGKPSNSAKAKNLRPT